MANSLDTLIIVTQENAHSTVINYVDIQIIHSQYFKKELKTLFQGENIMRIGIVSLAEIPTLHFSAKTDMFDVRKIDVRSSRTHTCRSSTSFYAGRDRSR